MKIKNQVLCDLRPYNSPEAMRKISHITDTVLLLIPKEMDRRTRAAYAAIEKRNIISAIVVEPDANPIIYNGNCTVNNSAVPGGESLLIANGRCRICPLSPGKFVRIIANGDLLYDIRSGSQVEVLQSNGNCIAANLDKLVEIPDFGTLSQAAQSDDPEMVYYSGGTIIVPRLAKSTAGTVIAPIVIADSAMGDAPLVFESGMVFYRNNVTGPIEIKKGMDKLYLSADFLKLPRGKLIVSNIRHVIIEESVTPELLREKVLLFLNVHHIKATRKTFDTVQLLAEQVKILSR